MASIGLYYHFHKEQNELYLKNQCQAMVEGLSIAENKVLYLKKLSQDYSQDVRMTLISAQGKVLFDSEVLASQMPNHHLRPEVLAAQQTGFGSDQRHSDTLGKVTHYCAMKVSNSGDVLRLAQDQKSMLGVFVQLLPLLVLVALLLFFISLLISHQLSKRIIEPIETAGLKVLKGCKADTYDELAPFLDMLSKQQETINAQMESIRHERDTITVILENMQEGLILLDKEQKIVSINQSVHRFFKFHVMDYIGMHILSLSRNPDLMAAIDKASQGESSSDVFQYEDISVRYFISPVLKEGVLNGVVILLVDLSSELKAQNLREDFSANVSHELKTPLTSISGYAELIKNGMVDNMNDVKNFADTIYHESARLLSLIDGIMRLSKLEKNPTTSMRRVEVSNLCESIVQRVRPLLDAKKLDVELSLPPTLFYCDPMQMDHLISNLVENAIKYSYAKGKIGIRIENNIDELIISVQDQGIGIPEADQQRIFERFYRVDKSHSKQTGGSGLGLAIVKHIVLLYKGRIHLESELNKGTVIKIILPVLKI